MKIIDPRTVHVLKNPVAFAFQVLKAFQANQGLLLAGAVAYYALLSIVPLLILMVIALSHVIDQEVLLATLRSSSARRAGVTRTSAKDLPFWLTQPLISPRIQLAKVEGETSGAAWTQSSK